MICSICGGRGIVKNLCSKHYQRLRAHGDPLHGEYDLTAVQRVEFDVQTRDRSTGCWEWDQHRTRAGYGRVEVGRRSKMAHRLAFSHEAEIPEGMCVLHRCDNPPCYNPDHLFLGTNADNTLDMVTKGRHGKAKLTADKVREIRRLYAEGYRQDAIAGWFDVNPPAISKVLSGSNWSHVD